MACSGCDWDPLKDVANFLKHGVWFEDACCIFDDPNRREEEGDRDYGEERWSVVGKADSTIVVVIFTERAGRERIISARKASSKEVQRYYGRSRGD